MPLASAVLDGAAEMETSFSLEGGKREDDVEGEGKESVAGLGDPGQLTAACEDFRCHMKALAWLCDPGSSALLVARNLRQPHQDLNCVTSSIFVLSD